VRIDARQNQLTTIPEIPEGIPGCESQLAELYLGNNQLARLPGSIGAMKALAVLDVGGNQLNDFPQEVQHCRPLRLLDVRNNNLSTLPPQLCKCANLNKVVLDGNPMRMIRRNIIEQGTRSILDFLRSRLPEDELEVEYSYDPASFEAILREAHSTRALDLARRGLSDVPAELSQGDLDLGSLGKVSFAENKLTALPPAILMQLGSVTDLDVSSNRLRELPHELQALTALTDLNASRNQLTEIPGCLTGMPSLRRLDLGGNEITRPRASMPALPALNELHLSSNGMVALPSGLSCLPGLSVLNVSQNKLTALPEQDILALKSLQSLDVSNNDLKELPHSMGNMEHIRALVLHGNPLRSIRRPILDKGTVAVLEFLRSRIVSDPSAQVVEEEGPGEEDEAAIMEGFNVTIGAIEEEMSQPGLSGPKVYALKKKLAMAKAAKKKEERRLAQKGT